MIGAPSKNPLPFLRGIRMIFIEVVIERSILFLCGGVKMRSLYCMIWFLEDTGKVTIDLSFCHLGPGTFDTSSFNSCI